MSQESTARSIDPIDGERPVDAPAGPAKTDGNAASGGGASGASSAPADAPPSTALADLALLGDISVNLSMEIGRTSITIAELLSLGKGSVVELQRLADEPLDILVNGTLVAHGEAVVVGERFGIRLTDVVSQRERLDKLT